jgi:hypothetical protein
MIKEKLSDVRGSGSYNEIYEYVESETGKKIDIIGNKSSMKQRL